MRNYTSTNVSVDYPGQLAWLLDNNFVYFRNLYGDYGMRVRMAVSVGGNTWYYDHTTEIGVLTYRLNAFLSQVPHGVTVYVVCDVRTKDSAQNQHNDTVKFNFVNIYGKTLQERHHGSTSVITYYDNSDLAKIDIYKPAGVTGNEIVGSNINNFTADEQILHNGWASGAMEAVITGTPAFTVGEIFDESTVSKWTVRLVQVCPAKNGIKFTYYDTDGCKRYAIGEVLTKKMQAARKDFHRGGVVYDEVPRSLVTGYTGTIEVGFSDVDPGQYLEDIMLSPIVTTTRGSDTIEVVPETLQLTRDGKTKDIIITFKIDA